MTDDRSQSRSTRTSILLAIDEICEKFEATWEAGSQPDLAAYVAMMPEKHRGRLLQDLIPSDVEYRLKAGQQPQRQEYAARFPQFLPNVDAAFADIDKLATTPPQQAEPASSPSLGLDAVKTYFKRLFDSGLMSRQDIEKFWNKLPADTRPQDSARLSDTLIQQGKLTPYQAQRILNNEIEHLLIDDYEVLDQIGEGGMGAVLKARHRRMRREVALKIINQKALQSPEALNRFQQEVLAAGQLSHPNIVTAFDAREKDGLHYFVMEYVQGQDLASLVSERGRVSVDEALDYVLQAAEGLRYAHSRQIIHRDIKPANLLLSHEGQIKILDMGLATLGESAEGDGTQFERLTQSGQIMGTVDYMAPEQALDTREADARSDIYALGCTLYRLITGKRMYEADTMMKTVMAHANNPIPSLAAEQPAVSEQLEEVFQRMVAKAPENRQQSMNEVIEQLTACRRGTILPDTSAGIDAFHRKPPQAKPAPPKADGDSSVDARTMDFTPGRDLTSAPALPEFAINAGGQTTAAQVARKRVTKQAATADTIVGQATEDTVRHLSPLVKLTRPPYRTYVGIGGGLFGFGALLALMVIFLQTPEGTLRVEINDPEIEVKVKGSDIVLTQADDEEITLTSGAHALVITRGNFSFETKQFILKKGATTTVKVDLLPGKVQVVSDGTVIDVRAIDGLATKPNRDAHATGPNYALEFDGQDSYVDLPIANIPSLPQYTVEAYVSAQDVNAIYQVWFVAANEESPVFNIAMGASEGEWQLQLAEEANKKHIGHPRRSGNGFTHVAYSWDGKVPRLFIDGVQVERIDAGTLAGDVWSIYKKYVEFTRLGAAIAADGAPKHPFSGQIDELRISKVARYTSNFKPALRHEPDADTLALYHFDEGQGDVLKDSSGNNHHGKIVGAKWVRVTEEAGADIADTSKTEPQPPSGKLQHKVGLIHSFVGHEAEVVTLDVAPDGKRFASLGADKTVRLWSLETGELLWTKSVVATNVQGPIRFADDNMTVVAILESSGQIIRFDADSGDVIGRFGINQEGVGGISPDGTRLVWLTQDCTLQLYDVREGKRIARHALKDLISMTVPSNFGWHYRGFGASLSANNRTALIAGTLDRLPDDDSRHGGVYMALVDVESGKLLHQLPEVTGIPYRNGTQLSRDGRFASVHYEYPTGVYIYEVKSGEKQFELVNTNLANATLSWIGSRFAAANRYSDEQFIFSLNGSKLERCSSSDNIHARCFTADGTALVTGQNHGGKNIQYFGLESRDVVEPEVEAGDSPPADASSEAGDGAVRFVNSTRTWSDKSGKFQIEAELVAVDGDSATLRKTADDKTVQVPIASLSEADQQFIEAWQASRSATE